MFKVGDKIKMIQDCSGCLEGEICEIHCCSRSGRYDCLFARGKEGECSCQNKWELISSSETISLGEKIMNIKEKFILALTKEPQKSFRKVGVTDGDDLLTEDGQKVFLSWLLHSKFADEFKKDVVDNMLKELEEKKC